MNTKITLTYKGVPYTLEYDRMSVKTLEANGFSIEDFIAKPAGILTDSVNPLILLKTTIALDLLEDASCLNFCIFDSYSSLNIFKAFLHMSIALEVFPPPGSPKNSVILFLGIPPYVA